MAGRSPPGPFRCGSTTCNAKPAATAASNALPPRSSTAMPAADASQCVEATMPNVPRSSGRVVNSTTALDSNVTPVHYGICLANIGTYSDPRVGVRVAEAAEAGGWDGVTLAPAPVQERVPVWIGGNRPASLRRAARWDGWLADSADPTGMTLSPDDVARSIERIARGDDFDVAVLGQSDRGDPAAYERAGATWWLEK